MMYEIRKVKQYEGEPSRKWFFDPDIDLTVWFDEQDSIVGFQLVYDRPLTPRAMTWRKASGYFHNRVDDGECPDTISRKGLPILLPDGRVNIEKIKTQLRNKCGSIDSGISEFVYARIAAYE
jgi:hypothetical protein